MKHKLLSVCWSMLFFYPAFVFGQEMTQHLEEIKKIAASVKSIRDESYRYALASEYPNGQKEQLKGTAYIGNEEKILYNDNPFFTLLYNGHWYYKADHKSKSVTIVNMDKHMTADYKGDLEKDIFENAAAGHYLDAVLTKYAAVKFFKRSHDTIYAELSFPPTSSIKRVSVVFDEKKGSLVSYYMQTFKPWRGSEFGKNKGTTQTVTCAGFKKIKKNKAYKPVNYFLVSGDKVSLKKYSKYKLNVKL
jgi:hypothetical protein